MKPDPADSAMASKNDEIESNEKNAGNCGDGDFGLFKNTESDMPVVVKPKKEKEKVKDNLLKLATIVQNEAEDVPIEEDSSKYLEDMEMLKLQNEQSKMLGIIDTIINMMKEGKIVGQDINQNIPDSIVVTVVEGEQPTEYICSQITKKWIMYRFQIGENDQFSVDLKTKNLVQITDKLENTCDVIGLVIRHSLSFQRNRIFPKYLVKNKKFSPARPSSVGDYSAFKGSCTTKKRPSSSKPHTPQRKVTYSSTPILEKQIPSSIQIELLNFYIVLFFVLFVNF